LGINAETNGLYSRDPGLDLGPGELEPNPDDPNNNQGDLDMIRKTVALRAVNPNLKVLISVGGKIQMSKVWSDMVRYISNRTQFIASVREWLMKYDLDGIDIHWEFPGFGDGGRPEEDKDNLSKLLSVRLSY
jgi:chitinase